MTEKPSCLSQNDENATRYPIYIPSKGRATTGKTAHILAEERLLFYLVVEPQEHDAYAKVFGEERLLVLPFRDAGTSVPARNWIKKHAHAAGHERHWQLDDNINGFLRVWKGKRWITRAGISLRAMEDFTDRYENIAISGPNYSFFVIGHKTPFNINVHVYSCMLILNETPFSFRGKRNEDTDYCLQALSQGWCTVLFNAFVIKKMQTMTMRGGNTDALYREDGRLEMARELERRWPGVVRTTRKFQRPQHHVYHGWQRFDTPLKLKEEVNLDELSAIDEYGMRLKMLRPSKTSNIERIRLYKERTDGEA